MWVLVAWLVWLAFVSVWLPVGSAVVDQDVTLVVVTMVISETETTGTETVVLGATVSVGTPAGDVVTSVMPVTDVTTEGKAGLVTGMQAPFSQLKAAAGPAQQTVPQIWTPAAQLAGPEGGMLVWCRGELRWESPREQP